MVRKTFLLAMALCICLPSMAAEKAIKHAYKSFVSLSYLHTASEKCGSDQYVNDELNANFEQFVEEKLLISFRKFKKIVTEESDFAAEMTSFRESFACQEDALDLDFDLQMLADNYEAALFLFEMAPSLKSPLLSEKEYVIARKKAIHEAVAQLIDDANSIAIGTLHDISQLPENYRDASIEVVGYEYAFETSYGWKQPPPHKFLPIKNLNLHGSLQIEWPGMKTEQQLAREEQQKRDSSIETYKGEQVMIIRGKRAWQLLHWQPVASENMEAFLAQLKDRHWEYHNGTFRYLDSTN